MSKEQKEPRAWTGVHWIDSIKADDLAEEIVDHFCVAIPGLMACRSGIVSEVEHEELSESALQEISSDLSEVLNGRDSGCIDPEDLDESNCSRIWVESKIMELLRIASNAALADSTPAGEPK